MTYLSVCSGIEAATVAWKPLGWQAAAFAEVDAIMATRGWIEVQDVIGYLSARLQASVRACG